MRPPILSLIVGVFSANLTRAGWWENLETGHVEEVRDLSVEESRIPFRKDLLSIMRRVRDLSPDDDHSALDQIHAFLRARTHRGQLQVSRHRRALFHPALFWPEIASGMACRNRNRASELEPGDNLPVFRSRPRGNARGPMQCPDSRGSPGLSPDRQRWGCDGQQGTVRFDLRHCILGPTS